MEACVREGMLKEACKLTGDWGLQPRFPGLEAQYEQRTMHKLLDKCLWNAAAGFAIDKPDFQVRPFQIATQNTSLAKRSILKVPSSPLRLRQDDLH